MVPIRFPAIYERVAPLRSAEQIEREMNRRSGYPVMEGAIAPVRRVDPVEARAGTVWEQKAKLEASRRKAKS